MIKITSDCMHSRYTGAPYFAAISAMRAVSWSRWKNCTKSSDTTGLVPRPHTWERDSNHSPKCFHILFAGSWLGSCVLSGGCSHCDQIL